MPLGVLILSIGIALLNSYPFLSNVFAKKDGLTYLSVSHYWQDYFFYVNHFFQGAHGAILTKNQYTSEMTPPTILYWVNILIGKIGGVFSLSPMHAYNIAIILLAFSLPLLIYTIAKRIYKKTWQRYLLLFFTLFATGFFNVTSHSPYQLWRTPHLLFYRFGGIPHHFIQTLSVLALFFLEIRFLKNPKTKEALLESLIVIVLTSINPIMTGVYLGGLFLGYIPTLLSLLTKRNYHTLKNYLIHLFILTVCFSITTFYMQTILALPPHPVFSAWETLQQIHTTLPNLLLSIGPITIFFIIGIIPAIRKNHPIWFSAITIPLFAYALFFSPIPKILGTTNTRTLFPALYLFIAMVSVEGLSTLSSILRNSTIPFRKYVIPILFSLFIFCSIPTIFWEIRGKIEASHDGAITTWIPTDIYTVYQKLSTLPDYDTVAIANPTFGFDTLIPALSGHTTYSGHMLTTIDNERKQSEVTQFFNLEMNQPEAREWLQSNRITYVILTPLDDNRIDFESHHPYLNPIFSSSNTTLYLFP